MTTIKITHIITRNERTIAVPAAKAHAYVNTFRGFLEFATFA